MFYAQGGRYNCQQHPRIQQNSPNVGDCMIIFPETGLHISLSLCGIFSYFPMTKAKLDALVDSPDKYMLTPSVWNPMTDVYATSEESMVDWEGNIADKRDQKKCLVLYDISDDQGMILSLAIPGEEHMAINSLHEEVVPGIQAHMPIPLSANQTL